MTQASSVCNFCDKRRTKVSAVVVPTDAIPAIIPLLCSVSFTVYLVILKYLVIIVVGVSWKCAKVVRRREVCYQKRALWPGNQ